MKVTIQKAKNGRKRVVLDKEAANKLRKLDKTLLHQCGVSHTADDTTWFKGEVERVLGIANSVVPT